MKKSTLFTLGLFTFVAVLFGCKKDETVTETGPTPYQLHIPEGLPAMNIPASNPLTVEGIALGRKLFYDPILSGDNTQSCGSCHMAEHSFVDGTQFSVGVTGAIGTRNVMPLVNLGYQPGFFWDGGAADLESQVIGPIQNPVEMHETLENCLQELRNHSEYPELFEKAFGENSVTIPNLMKAVAQFERTMISGNSRYDKYLRGQATLTSDELRGLDLFSDFDKGDCTHCHVLGSTFSDFVYRNTGLDSISEDLGRMAITQNEFDKGKFKTPSLRNIALTGPYMHDGRFETLLECVQHYNTGFHYAPNLDFNLQLATKGRMTDEEMGYIVAFMLTLTDEEFINNPAFRAQ